jgi:hypothetical protein
MRPFLLVPLILLCLLPAVARSNDELITLPSSHTAPVTTQRLQDAITAEGWTILATVDHAAHAVRYGVPLLARTTIIFADMQASIGHL